MIVKQGRSTVTFVFRPGNGAKTVSVVGSFNGWKPERGQMKAQRDGTFRRTETLSPGRYEYKFFVDGRWYIDPESEGRIKNVYGTENSLVAVS